VELTGVEKSVKDASGDMVKFSHNPKVPSINQVLQETHKALCDIDNILQS